MSYAAHRRDFASCVDDAEARPASGGEAAKSGFWRRWLHAFMRSRQRQADHAIARHFATHGFTDGTEREVMRFLLHHRH